MVNEHKSIAYLGWPVVLKHPFLDRAHITLKFIGEGPFSAEDIAHRLQGLKTAFAFTSMEWAPEIFDGGTHVMRLSGVDRALEETRKAVDSLKKHDWLWNPHITFKKELWYHIQDHNLKVDDVVNSIGPLTLFFREARTPTKAVYTF